MLLLLAWPLGRYIARVYEGSAPAGPRAGRRWNDSSTGLSGIDAAREHDWKKYAVAILLFNFIGFVVVYLLQRLQGVLPLNPQGFAGVNAGLRVQHGRELSPATPTGRATAAKRR